MDSKQISKIRLIVSSVNQPAFATCISDKPFRLDGSHHFIDNGLLSIVIARITAKHETLFWTIGTIDCEEPFQSLSSLLRKEDGTTDNWDN